jgi:hypothetical protein
MSATLRRWLGTLLMAVGFGGLLLLSTISQWDLDLPLTILAGAAIGIVSAGVGMLGRTLAMSGRKLQAARTAAVRSLDARPPVLYLRSFADDEGVADANVVDGFIQLSTEEEQFAKVFDRIGPFTAIGNPREGLPTLGASRFYVGDADWQVRVEELLRSAALVVLRIGGSEGLLWELQHAVAAVTPRRLLLLIPGQRRHYDAIRRVCDAFLPRPLPDLPKAGRRLGTVQGIVRFAADWTPEFVPLQFSIMRVSLRAPLAPHLLLTLRPLFEELHVPWSKPPLSAFSLFFAALITAIVIGLLLSLFGVI